MTLRRTVPALAVLAAVLGVAGCSNGTTAAGSPGAPSPVGPASATSLPSAPAPSSPTAPTAQTVAGGGATDFCSAYQEWKDAVQADTPQAQGAGFRAAAVDIRTFAPAAIKKAAGLYADVMDEVGQTIEAGGTNPGLLGSGQSEERRQALADSITWIDANCH